jgi:hypothetical protein
VDVNVMENVKMIHELPRLNRHEDVVFILEKRLLRVAVAFNIDILIYDRRKK